VGHGRGLGWGGVVGGLRWGFLTMLVLGYLVVGRLRVEDVVEEFGL
jgi:hypothetical protein